MNTGAFPQGQISPWNTAELPAIAGAAPQLSPCTAVDMRLLASSRRHRTVLPGRLFHSKNPLRPSQKAILPSAGSQNLPDSSIQGLQRSQPKTNPSRDESQKRHQTAQFQNTIKCRETSTTQPNSAILKKLTANSISRQQGKAANFPATLQEHTHMHTPSCWHCWTNTENIKSDSMSAND